MARIVGATLDAATDLGKLVTSPMLDLSYGGQLGWSPNQAEWVSNQAYVRRQLVCILLEAPRFFQVMPQPKLWVQSLKSLVELHARSIEGLKADLTVDTDEHPAGGAGEMMQEFTDVKRARSEPAFTFIEKYGMPISTFLQAWITYGMMDPDTKFAMVGTLAGNPAGDLLADWYTMTCLFFEPDPTFQMVTKAWVCTNMFPKGTGAIEGKRDLTTAGELNTLNIEFTAISQYNFGTKIFAQTILNQINATNANPNLKSTTFTTGVDANVSGANGYKTELQNVGQSAILV